MVTPSFRPGSIFSEYVGRNAAFAFWSPQFEHGDSSADPPLRKRCLRHAPHVTLGEASAKLECKREQLPPHSGRSVGQASRATAIAILDGSPLR
jgi:hypothetical protein